MAQKWLKLDRIGDVQLVVRAKNESNESFDKY